jgi:hypothetical protein
MQCFGRNLPAGCVSPLLRVRSVLPEPHSCAPSARNTALALAHQAVQNIWHAWVSAVLPVEPSRAYIGTLVMAVLSRTMPPYALDTSRRDAVPCGLVSGHRRFAGILLAAHCCGPGGIHARHAWRRGSTSLRHRMSCSVASHWSGVGPDSDSSLETVLSADGAGSCTGCSVHMQIAVRAEGAVRMKHAQLADYSSSASSVPAPIQTRRGHCTADVDLCASAPKGLGFQGLPSHVRQQ